MVALNRLTGHSPGFFSVYTLPPNQAVSVKSQRKINAKRNQTPRAARCSQLILKKTAATPRRCDHRRARHSARGGPKALLLTSPAHATPQIPLQLRRRSSSPRRRSSTSCNTPPTTGCAAGFLASTPTSVKLTVPRKIADVAAVMTDVFHELHRVLKPGGHVAFEVGEVHAGKTKLEEAVLPCGIAAGLEPLLVLINDQKFTKTANCWGVDNMAKGTNTNRIVVFRRS